MELSPSKYLGFAPKFVGALLMNLQVRVYNWRFDSKNNKKFNV